MVNDGAVALRAYLERHNISQRDAAKALFVTHQTLAQWLSGEKRPSVTRGSRAAIYLWTNETIDECLWDLPWSKTARQMINKIKPFKES